MDKVSVVGFLVSAQNVQHSTEITKTQGHGDGVPGGVILLNT